MSILRSLMLDTSSTLCTAGLTLLVKLLPLYAVHARTSLKSILGELFAVLSRILVWKERPPASFPESTDEPLDPVFEQELERERNRLMIIPIRPDFHWRRLELTFDATTSLAPPLRPYFTILYYLYPSNVLKFLSSPAQYLIDLPLPSPYTLDWSEALPQDEIRRRSEVCFIQLFRNDTHEYISDYFVNTCAILYLCGVMQQLSFLRMNSGQNIPPPE